MEMKLLVIHLFSFDVSVAIGSSVEVGFDSRIGLDVNFLVPSSSISAIT